MLPPLAEVWGSGGGRGGLELRSNAPRECQETVQGRSRQHDLCAPKLEHPVAVLPMQRHHAAAPLQEACRQAVGDKKPFPTGSVWQCQY